MVLHYLHVFQYLFDCLIARSAVDSRQDLKWSMVIFDRQLLFDDILLGYRPHDTELAARSVHRLANFLAKVAFDHSVRFLTLSQDVPLAARVCSVLN